MVAGHSSFHVMDFPRLSISSGGTTGNIKECHLMRTCCGVCVGAGHGGCFALIIVKFP